MGRVESGAQGHGDWSGVGGGEGCSPGRGQGPVKGGGVGMCCQPCEMNHYLLAFTFR